MKHLLIITSLIISITLQAQDAFIDFDAPLFDEEVLSSIAPDAQYISGPHAFETIQLDEDKDFFIHSEDIFKTISLSNSDEKVFQNLPVYSDKLHLNLNNYTSGVYDLLVYYENNPEPSIIQITLK